MAPADAPDPSRRLRLALLAIVVVALVGIGAWLRHSGKLSVQALTDGVTALGPWAVPAFLVAFVLGELVHVPGMLFVVAARLAFGPVLGLALGYGGSILAVTAPFLLARFLGADRPRVVAKRLQFVKRLLDGVESRPVRNVVLLRLVLWLAPPLDYALAFTSIRTRDYVVGSALGLMPVIALASYGVSWLQ
jgi:uncharacterized membrane protein YdjX (TVP38/TMEM64 family)